MGFSIIFFYLHIEFVFVFQAFSADNASAASNIFQIFYLYSLPLSLSLIVSPINRCAQGRQDRT